MKIKTGVNRKELRLPSKGDVVIAKHAKDETLQLGIVIDRIDSMDMEIVTLPYCNHIKVSIDDYEPYLGDITLYNDNPYKE